MLRMSILLLRFGTPVLSSAVSLTFWRCSSSSSKKWQSRQGRDKFSRAAKVQGLKSRAAFKLLEIDDRYKIFKRGQTVIDLGYAPGSWSQVAAAKALPGGRIFGIDIIPAQPPKGVSTIQGNFLDPAVQDDLIKLLQDPDYGYLREDRIIDDTYGQLKDNEEVLAPEQSYIDLGAAQGTTTAEETTDKKMVDVVLSDMSDPWPQTSGFYKNSLSDPYRRMMNTSGIPFRDHVGSMDLCDAALSFSEKTLKRGGHFVCKYYQGSEEAAFEARLKQMFANVHREKPSSSRAESREAYFVGLRRK